MKKLILFVVACVLALSLNALAEPFSNKGKKIIEYGWDVKDAMYLKDHADVIEKYPFDGVVFTINKTHAFDLSRWTKEELKPQYDAVRAIKWKKFTDNFMILHSANDFGMDWFNDKHWETILANAKDFASVARAGKCAGIIFDTEPYGVDPWAYSIESGNRTTPEVLAQFRKRGRQWVQALEKDWPNMRLLLFFFNTDSKNTLGAFCTGLIEGARGNVKIINGNEVSYYHTSYDEYVYDWKSMTIAGAQQMPPDLTNQYKKHFQAGMALYMDQTLALREPGGNFISYYMNAQDRLKYFEATVYWALKSTDEYVWCYSEKLDWWTASFPTGADEAIRRAKAKLAAGEGLGFSLEARVKHANRDREEALLGKVQKPVEDIQKIPVGVAAPIMDGKSDDAAWQNVKPLADFVDAGTLDAKKFPVKTSAKVTYDDANLYVLVNCQELDMSKLVPTGVGRDSDVWKGDTIELFVSTSSLSPYSYRHFIINANNVQWDGTAPPPSNDASWDGKWTSGASKDSDSWTVELAIPWSDLDGKPAPSSYRYANICRQSTQSGWSSWATVLDGFLDAARFGQWVFKD